MSLEKKLWGDHDTGEPGIMTLKGADALAAAPKVRTLPLLSKLPTA